MGKFVAIKIYDEVEIHATSPNGNHATLCGLDGDDPDAAVGQSTVDTPPNAKIDCSGCQQIILTARKYTKKDFIL